MLLKDAPFGTILRVKGPHTLAVKEMVGGKEIVIDLINPTLDSSVGNYWTIGKGSGDWECEIFTGNLQITNGFGNFEK